jgi:hypothetical protein
VKGAWRVTLVFFYGYCYYYYFVLRADVQATCVWCWCWWWCWPISGPRAAHEEVGALEPRRRPAGWSVGFVSFQDESQLDPGRCVYRSELYVARLIGWPVRSGPGRVSAGGEVAPHVDIRNGVPPAAIYSSANHVTSLVRLGYAIQSVVL